MSASLAIATPGAAHAHLPTPHSSRLSIEACGLTHTGWVRSVNEDAYVVRPDLGLFAVADGLGGHAAGEIASRMAIEVVTEEIEGAGVAEPARAGPILLRGGVDLANEVIHATAGIDPSTQGMGTTFTGILLCGRHLVIAHVGDCRLYRLRDARLECLTVDHTWVQAMVQRGAMTPEEAATSMRRNELLHAVGLAEYVKVDTRMSAVEPGDVYLLSSDGLHGVVGDDAIADVLRREHDPTRAAQWLLDQALDAGGPDNVTVVLVRVGDRRR